MKKAYTKAVQPVSGFLAALLFSIMTVGGCARYAKMPLDAPAVARNLTPPSVSDLRIQARQIKHPNLKPVEINEENGLAPDEAAIIAVLANPKLKAERDKRGVSVAQLYQAGILPNPQFSGSLDFPTTGSTQGTVTAFGLGLSYDTYALVTRGAEIDAAEAEDASVDLQVAWQEWQIAESAKLHAYRLFLLERQLAVAQQEEEGLQKNLAVVEEAVRLRDSTLIDLSAARASFQKVRLSVIGIEQNLKQEQLALNLALGFPPERTVQLQQGIAVPASTLLPALSQLTDGLEARRLDLLALKMGYQSQEERLRAAVLGQFPKISIGFSGARDNTNVISTGPTVGISLPVFDRNQGIIAIERATRQQLFDEYVARLFEARSNLATSYANIEWIQRQIQATEKYLPALKNLVQTYHRALLEGNADVLTYYNARDELIAERIALLSLQLQLVDQFIALEIACGEYLETKEIPE